MYNPVEIRTAIALSQSILSCALLDLGEALGEDNKSSLILKQNFRNVPRNRSIHLKKTIDL